MDTVVGPSGALDLVFPSLASSGLHGWPVPRFYMFDLTAPTHYVDIAGQPLQRKLDAFACHHSQYTSLAYLKANVEWTAAQVARASGHSAVAYAEGYRAYF